MNWNLNPKPIGFYSAPLTLSLLRRVSKKQYLVREQLNSQGYDYEEIDAEITSHEGEAEPTSEENLVGDKT